MTDKASTNGIVLSSHDPVGVGAITTPQPILWASSVLQLGSPTSQLLINAENSGVKLNTQLVISGVRWLYSNKGWLVAVDDLPKCSSWERTSYIPYGTGKLNVAAMSPEVSPASVRDNWFYIYVYGTLYRATDPRLYNTSQLVDFQIQTCVPVSASVSPSLRTAQSGSLVRQGVGQAPTPTDCSTLGLPTEACTLVDSQAALQTASGWTGSNVLQTFKQWYAALNGGSAPPADNTNGDYTAGSNTANLIVAAVTYWSTVGAADPTDTSAVDPSAWAFPWQYATSAVFGDANTAVMNAWTAMLADPAAVTLLNQGVLPTFDPTKTTWTNVQPASAWSTIADSIGNTTATLQAFVSAGSACAFFSGTATAVQAAWTAYITSSINPCTGQVQPVLPTLPTTPTTTPTTPLPVPANPAVPIGGLQPVVVIQQPTTAVQATSPWVPVTLLLVGAGVVGYGIYAYSKSRPTSLRRNPTSDAGYRRYRTSVANQLINVYGYRYGDVDRILDAPGQRYDTISEDLYRSQVSSVKAAATIDKAASQYIQR
jgi:hypothetical protein